MATEQMISTSPNPVSSDAHALAECEDACAAAELACVACADACLGERDLNHLKRCIRLGLDCADVCGATGRVLTRLLEPDPEVLSALLEACACACATVATECLRHADQHLHCQLCADACLKCEEACEQVLAGLAEVE